jgi:hypothetical protein
MRELILRKLIILTSIYFLFGCVAAGQKFNGIQKFESDKCTVYVLRESRFQGGAYCPSIQMDNQDLVCLKNGGFIRISVSGGPHILAKRVGFLEATSRVEHKFTCSPDDVLYFEWTNKVVDQMGVMFAFSDKFVPHTESTALPLLHEMKEQKTEDHSKVRNQP